MSTGAFRETSPIILASGSPRRKELLQSTGIGFTIIASRVVEPAPTPNESPSGYALRMARLKAASVAAAHPGAFILSADTVVAVDGVILGKPQDAADARRMLGMLSGRAHLAATGCVLTGPQGSIAWEEAFTSRVTFIALSKEMIAAYAATGEPLDKAGGYAIQGLGAFMIAKIEGSYTNVVGLPVAEVVRALLSLGAVAPRPAL